MTDPKFRVKILGYETGSQDAIIDEKLEGIKAKDLMAEVWALVKQAIDKQAYEIILDIFEETKGAD